MKISVLHKIASRSAITPLGRSSVDNVGIGRRNTSLNTVLLGDHGSPDQDIPLSWQPNQFCGDGEDPASRQYSTLSSLHGNTSKQVQHFQA